MILENTTPQANQSQIKVESLTPAPSLAPLENKTKAGSKAQKLCKRRGRPRLESVAREPNGRKSRRKTAVKTREELTEKDIQSVALEARIRHLALKGVPKQWAHLAEAGYALGRVTLMFPGRLRPQEVEAGKLFCIDYARYYALSGIPFPSPRAANLLAVQGFNNFEDATKAKAAANRVMKIENILGLNDIAGRPITRLVKQVCIMDDDSQMRFEHMVKFLQKGLDVLSDFYGLNEKRPLF